MCIRDSAMPVGCRIDTERFAQTETINEYYWLQQVGTIGSQKVPLVIVLHGGGGCGNSLESLQKIKGQSQGVSRGIEIPYLVYFWFNKCLNS